MIPIQFITHQTERYTYEESAQMALAGGCKWIQLRIKGQSDELVMPIATRIQIACKEAGATFIIDDRVELAQQINADGVHLGKDDMPIAEARKRLGEGFIIGGTANTFDDILSCYRQVLII
jgi:thiamine-phosphate pyrophosphorylase